MKKIIYGMCYAILILVVILEIIFAVVLWERDQKQQEMSEMQSAVFSEMETAVMEDSKEPDKEELKEENSDVTLTESVYRVVVNKLPVYETSDIAANAKGNSKSVLQRGEVLTVLDYKEGYSKVQLPDGTQGYVWFDCIEKLTQEEYQKKSTKVVVIDAGHQGKQNSEPEPVGPGETATKAKVAAGTQGIVSKQPEHELNLIISLLAESILEEKGYTAVMVRKTADMNISNAERAMVANQIEADAFIRIHADGSENPDAQGSMTIISTSSNKYEVANYYNESRKLAEVLLDAYTQATGIRKNRIMESDSYSGINWGTVPVTILEMGYMTNAKEDEQMQDPKMQEKMAEGIVNGILNYFGS